MRKARNENIAGTILENCDHAAKKIPLKFLLPMPIFYTGGSAGKDPDMKVEPIKQAESTVRIERKGSDNLRNEVEPQKAEREHSEKQVPPRTNIRDGGMDVTA